MLERSAVSFFALARPRSLFLWASVALATSPCCAFAASGLPLALAGVVHVFCLLLLSAALVFDLGAIDIPEGALPKMT